MAGTPLKEGENQTGIPQAEFPGTTTNNPGGELTRRRLLIDRGPKLVFGGIAAYGAAKAKEAWDTINREGVLAGLEQLNPIRESVTTIYHYPQDGNTEGLYSVSFARINNDGRFHSISDENPYTRFTFDNLTREEAGGVAAIARGGVDNLEQLDPLTLLVIASVTPSLKPLVPHPPSVTRRELLIAGVVAAGTLAAGGGLRLLSMTHEERSQLFDGLGKNLKGLWAGITTFNPFRGNETIKVVPTAWAQVQASTTPSPSAPVFFESTEPSVTPTIPKPTVTATPSPAPKPTATETLVPTATATPTPKAEITPIQMKVLQEFKLTSADYKSGGYVGTNREFSVPPTSFYEVVKDPTGIFGGEYVIHSRIDGPPPDTKTIRENFGVHRPYPVYHTIEGSGSWALEFSTVLTSLPQSEVYTNSGGGSVGKKWFSVVSAGVATSDNPTNIKAGAFLVTDRGAPHLELYTQNKSPSSSVDNPSRYTKPLPYPIGEKVRIRLEFLQGDSGQPKVRLFQNDIFIDETTIEAKDAFGLPGRTLRTGLYAGQGVRGPLEIYEGELKIYVP